MILWSNSVFTSEESSQRASLILQADIRENRMDAEFRHIDNEMPIHIPFYNASKILVKMCTTFVDKDVKIDPVTAEKKYRY